MQLLEIGKPFPGAYPTQEGVVLELQEDGLTAFVQFPGLTKSERQAFKKSFKQYSYLETDTPIPIAMWIFDFPKPFNALDCNFNARIVKPEYVKDYLTPQNDQVKNRIMFYLLDGNILKGIKTVGLQPEAVKLFHDTIQKQLNIGYTQSDYAKYLTAMYQFDSDELFKMGTVFKK